MRILSFLPVILLLTLSPLLAHAEAEKPFRLPFAVIEQVKQPLKQLGNGRYRKFGFTIYQATLWTAKGEWDPTQPYALQLRYTRDLSQSTLVEAVIEGMEEQETADRPTLIRWEETLNQTLPAVKEGDEIIGVSIPGADSHLFLNGKPIAAIQEKAFSDAFFGIWFGKYADPSLRASLIGQ